MMVRRDNWSSAIVYNVCVSEIYEASRVKRQRRTNAQLAAVDTAIIEAIRQDAPVTLRGVFYRVVSAGAVEKSETGYGLVGRQLLKLRRAGLVSYGDIADGTRHRYRPRTYTDLDEMLDDAAESYRRALWHDQDAYVEIFSEKDAISGAIMRVTNKWDVPLSVVRGYSSETFTWQTACEVARQIDRDKLAFLYQLGDHDPSGVDAWRSFQERVSGFLDDWGYDVDYSVCFERIAVTSVQIEEMSLPTRPTKQKDVRAAKFGDGGSVEVDAIPAPVLRQIVTDAIEQHIDQDALEQTRMAEREERDLMQHGHFTRLAS